MGYYYAGSRIGRADKDFAVESTEMWNQRNAGYPGSNAMREQGWNPYRDEEEPVQYREEAVQYKGDAGQYREGAVRYKEEPMQYKEDAGQYREGLMRYKEEPMQYKEDAGQYREGAVRYKEEPMQYKEDAGQYRKGLVPYKEDAGEYKDEPVRRDGWGKRHSLMMEMPELNDEEQRNMNQWSRPSECQECWRAAGPRSGQPYQRYDYLDVLEDERMMEHELRKLQSMYPQAAKDILPMVEDACDKMEYEGSMMFDEHPDQNTVRRMSGEIYSQVSGMYPEMAEQQPEEVQSMEYQRGRRRPPQGNFLDDLVQVMLVQEMHRRRCRHHRCRPGRY